MRALLVTSKVTFIPENYNDLVLPLAEDPNIAGLLVLDNAENKLLIQGLGFSAVGAIRTGLQLALNQLQSQSKQRKEAYESRGKFYRELATINSQEALDLVQEQKIDLIVNARTRFIYRKPILEAPKLGCINIHHGLLPEQRGTMCDLWALSQDKQAGFSVHEMNQKIDDGKILARVIVSEKEKNYQKYLQKSAKRESEKIRDILSEIAEKNQIDGSPNKRTANKHFKNPTVKEILMMQRKGMKL